MNCGPLGGGELMQPRPYEEQFAQKYSIVRELFIDTADDNYVAARWCFHEGLNVDFFWLAVHCIEKYLKAALLLNGHTSKSYRHNIIKLYQAVKPLAPELLPDDLNKPETMPADLWRNETVGQFIERLYRFGQADNRYQLYGFSRHAEDLWKFDQVVFNVRRLCQPLEAHFLGQAVAGAPNESRRQRMLKDHETSWILHANLEATMEGKRGNALRHALLNWNHMFAPIGYEHTAMEYRYSTRQPVFIRRLFDPLRGGSKNFPAADALWGWVKKNIQLPNELIKEIEAEQARLKSQATP